jgi:hypothetical protein
MESKDNDWLATGLMVLLATVFIGGIVAAVLAENSIYLMFALLAFIMVYAG